MALVLVGLAAAGCGGSDEQAASSGDQGSASAGSAELRQEAQYWQQLTSLFEPVELTSMSDHRAYMLPSGYLLALHFDNLDLERAKNLNWVALGVPGRFCRKDQARVEAEFGPGFTHFHDLEADTHGGKPGAKGVWFVHTAVRDFEAPWGQVSQGIDSKFMPTAAPSCGAA
ncbi:MAG: hypothetical protein ACRDON_05980 [Gaiellaceae bacterium]